MPAKKQLTFAPLFKCSCVSFNANILLNLTQTADSVTLLVDRHLNQFNSWFQTAPLHFAQARITFFMLSTLLQLRDGNAPVVSHSACIEACTVRKHTTEGQLTSSIRSSSERYVAAFNCTACQEQEANKSMAQQIIRKASVRCASSSK